MSEAIIVSAFGWYKSRLRIIEHELVSRGYHVSIYLSDFDNITKRRVVKLENCRYIHVPSYRSNFSLVRLLSHICFANRIVSIIKKVKPEVIYALIPPNSVSYVCARYKRKHQKCRLFFDVIDMWPESYTGKRISEAPFRIWASIRDYGLRYADHVLTECMMYQTRFRCLEPSRLSTLYICRDSALFLPEPKWDRKNLTIAYLGSINNVVDIPVISDLISELVCSSFDVRLKIIGTGERTDEFVESLRHSGATVEYFGAIFDKQVIMDIFTGCHFALNIMKEIVCVGITTKSIDYFQMGIPVLNTIQGDTERLVTEYHCGLNVNKICKTAESLRQMEDTDYLQMRRSSQQVFQELFMQDSCASRIRSIFDGRV